MSTMKQHSIPSVPQQKMIVDREIRKIITSICYEKGQAMIEEIYDQGKSERHHSQCLLMI